MVQSTLGNSIIISIMERGRSNQELTWEKYTMEILKRVKNQDKVHTFHQICLINILANGKIIKWMGLEF